MIQTQGSAVPGRRPPAGSDGIGWVAAAPPARRAAASDAGPTQRSAAGLPVTGGRAVHRAVAPRLGAWLIEFGTKLGGATIRTS